MSRHMINAGHEVHMICGIYDISGLEPLPWYRLFRRENIDGIDVTVCNVVSSNKFGVLKRASDTSGSQFWRRSRHCGSGNPISSSPPVLR